MNEKLLTILTPTYNRAKDLIRLFQSLFNQEEHNFTWLIIDDGSNDNTFDVVDSFSQERFNIEYYYKNNGGKHTAHNFGLNYIKTPLTMIVDSDDILSLDATKTIREQWESFKDNNICGMSFLKEDSSGNISGLKFPKDKFVGNFIDVRINKNDLTEKAEVWKTDILRKYPFPEFKNEKYVGEGAIWTEIAKEYDMLFVNKVIYYFEYQQDGLTNAGRKLRVENPLGGMYAAKVAFSSEFNLSYRIKKMILYICYGFLSDSNMVKKYYLVPYKLLFILCFPIGYVLYIYWKWKYKQ